MSRVYDVNWICEYDMSWYPFDTQTCYMTLQPDGNSGEFIDLVDDGLEYLGPRDLTQYFIRSTKMIQDRDTGSINVMVVLGRRLLGQVWPFIRTKCKKINFRDGTYGLYSYPSSGLYFLHDKLLQAVLL